MPFLCGYIDDVVLVLSSNYSKSCLSRPADGTVNVGGIANGEDGACNVCLTHIQSHPLDDCRCSRGHGLFI